MKPILFADFDGVINAFIYDDRIVSEDTHFALDTVDYAVSLGKKYTLNFSSELVNQFRDLIVDDAVKWLWLTTWRDEAVTNLNPVLGFPEGKAGYLPWQDTTISTTNPQIGKYFGLNDYILEQEDRGLLLPGTPIIWVDDVATMGFADLSETDIQRLQNNPYPQPMFHYPTLIIKPDMRWGISRAEMQQIHDFIEHHK